MNNGYTTLAHRYTAKFPALTYIGIQVNFWILANMLLATIVHLHAHIISQEVQSYEAGNFSTMLLIAISIGFLYGLTTGLAGYFLEQRILRKLSFGKIILFKTLLAIVLLALILWSLRLVSIKLLHSPSFYIAGIVLNAKSWDYIFYLLLIYYFFMTLIISFINQVNKKYGPGVLVPLLLGQYRKPKEEERIFMFMDLKSSTATAEKLGHLKYSSFIRDCFVDINEVLYLFYAQVYQYVGDEIVVMWPESEGLRKHNCIRFYFACKKQFHDRAGYYMANYGFLPVFKAGMHLGKVSAVEIGEIKKDIAYHGDTLNTSARIQSVCNEFNRDFLVSDHLLRKIGLDQHMRAEHIGLVLLKGKTEKVGLVSVDWIS